MSTNATSPRGPQQTEKQADSEKEGTTNNGNAPASPPPPQPAPRPTSASGAPSGPAPRPAAGGEITGLQTAIAYAQGSAATAAHAATQDEMAIAALRAGGTTGASIAALQASMEQHGKNAEHYRAAAAELMRQLQVRESYQANPGAGTKQFVTAE